MQFLSIASDDNLADPEDADFSSFQPTLTSLRQRFSDSPNSDPVKAAQAELGAVKDIMTQNVEQILSRGERIELLMDRTGEAANQSMAFRRRAKGLRRSMWWKNTKVTALAGFCALVRSSVEQLGTFLHSPLLSDRTHLAFAPITSAGTRLVPLVFVHIVVR